MATEKVDRRVKRTRKLLLQSLTELLEVKDLKDITVKEISEHADLNRGTFYLHYKDVFDMMEQFQKELFGNFNEIVDKNAPSDANDTPYNLLYQIFLFLQENREICKVMMGFHGDYQFIMSLRNLVKDHMAIAWSHNNYSPQSLEYYYAYSITGILGLIQYWLECDCDKTPEEMASATTEIVLKDCDIFCGLFPAK